jgi:hypothetical protein
MLMIFDNVSHLKSGPGVLLLHYGILKDRSKPVGNPAKIFVLGERELLHKHRSGFYKCEIMILRMAALYCTSNSPLSIILHCRPAQSFRLYSAIV